MALSERMQRPHVEAPSNTSPHRSPCRGSCDTVEGALSEDAGALTKAPIEALWRFL